MVLVEYIQEKIQIFKFGSVRPILNFWHPETKKLTYWFPSLFVLFSITSIILLLFNIKWPFYLLCSYYFLALVMSLIKTKSIIVAFQSLIAITIQFFGYGYGFIKSALLLKVSSKSPEALFPDLFFKKK